MRLLWIASVCLLLSACTVNIQFYPTEVPTQSGTDTNTSVDTSDTTTDGQSAQTTETEESQTSTVETARTAIPYALEQKFVSLLQYTEEPDDLTRSLTEFIYYATWFNPPVDNFTSIDEADATYLLKAAIMSTQPIDIDQITDVDQRNYIETNSLNGYILKEHVLTTAQYLFATDVSAELANTDMIQWDEEKQAYYPPETSLTIYNPVILDYKELANCYVVTYALPQQVLSSEGLYSYDDLPVDSQDYLSLAEAVLNCDQHEMVINKNEDGTLTLVSHQLIDDTLIEQ
ncbi:MAG TPA: hypothetical protein DCY20_01950 [Firmicutes bacterium]|nr:hypothetical protein [Bacillota bacterium]